MKTEVFTVKGSGGLALPCVLWLPEGQLRAMVQVTHGMTEHMGRYTKLARVLTTCGIAVAGFDLRGHGRNGPDSKVASFGEGGWDATLEDMHLFRGYLVERLGGLPHFMVGFSLGSFLLREYLSRYGTQGIAGAVIMGTGQQSDSTLTPMMGVVKGQIKKCGFDGTTPLVRKLSFETYNTKFRDNRTRADWLCTDEKELAEYLADPLVRESISAGLFYQLLGAMKRTGETETYANWERQFPVLLLSGKDDPVGDFGDGVKLVEAAMVKAGLQGVQSRILPIVRHDIFHEEHSRTAAQVRTLIAAFVCIHM